MNVERGTERFGHSLFNLFSVCCGLPLGVQIPGKEIDLVWILHAKDQSS